MRHSQSRRSFHGARGGGGLVTSEVFASLLAHGRHGEVGVASSAVPILGAARGIFLRKPDPDHGFQGRAVQSLVSSINLPIYQSTSPTC